MNSKKIAVFGLAGAAALAGWMLYQTEQPTVVEAADHAEAPGTSADAAADIGDFYAWHDSNINRLHLVMTYDAAKAPAADQTATYDADVLYGFHIDNDGDSVSDIDIYVRYGQDENDEWGVQAVGLPSDIDPLAGAVETELTSGGNAKLQAGLFDDPFFFDLEGFNATLASGTLSFDPTRDSIAGANASAIVLQIPTADLGGTDLQVWGTTARITGGN